MWERKCYPLEIDLEFWLDTVGQSIELFYLIYGGLWIPARTKVEND